MSIASLIDLFIRRHSRLRERLHSPGHEDRPARTLASTFPFCRRWALRMRFIPSMVLMIAALRGGDIGERVFELRLARQLHLQHF